MNTELSPELESLWKELRLDDPSSHTARLLQVIALRGIADTAHADVLGLSPTVRDKHLVRLADAGLTARLSPSEKLRIGKGGRRATYQLTDLGVEACQALGFLAHPYGQTGVPAQRHDIYLTDLALAVQDAGHSVELERPIHYGRQGIIRPDAVVRFTEQPDVLFEIEGPAGWNQRARLVDKGLNYLAFFLDSAATPFSTDVRVLLELTRAADLDAARRTWAEAIAAVRAEHGGSLPVRFWGHPILDFFKHPDWTGLSGFHRLDDPALAPDFGLATLSQAESQPDAPADPLAQLIPPEALSGPVLDPSDQVRFRAHARCFQRYLQQAPRRFSPTFFETVRDVHALAFPRPGASTSAADLFALPWVALLTLRTWIHHFPDLAQALRQAHRRYKSARYSGVMMSQQAATEIVDDFLAFHGLRHDSDLLTVWVARPGKIERHSRFTVRVEMRLPHRFRPPTRRDTASPGLLPSEAGQAAELVDGHPLSDRGILHRTITALQWVLQQLIDYPDILEVAPEPSKQSKSSKRRRSRRR